MAVHTRESYRLPHQNNTSFSSLSVFEDCVEAHCKSLTEETLVSPYTEGNSVILSTTWPGSSYFVQLCLPSILLAPWGNAHAFQKKPLPQVRAKINITYAQQLQKETTCMGLLFSCLSCVWHTQRSSSLSHLLIFFCERRPPKIRPA